MKPGVAVTLLLCLSVSCRALPAEESPESPPRYGLLPLRNLSSDQDAPELLTSLLRQVLVERGAQIVPADELERILVARRIRNVESVSGAAARAIASETGATHLLVGSLIVYEPVAPPRISLSLGVLDAQTGRRVQSALVSLSGDDFTGLLGLGTIHDVDVLAQEVIARSADMLDGRAWPRALEIDRRRLAASMPAPWHLQMNFVDPALELEPGTRVAILPLTNRSNYPAAGLVFVDVLAHAWLQGYGIEALETSELLDVLRRARVTSMEGFDPTVIVEAVRSAGVRYVVQGTVEYFDPQAPGAAGPTPELEVWVRLVDVDTDRVVAGVGLRHRGEDYERVLGLGAEIDAIRLASRSARELLATLSD